MHAFLLTALALATPSVLVVEPDWIEEGQSSTSQVVFDFDDDGEDEIVRLSLPSPETLRVEVAEPGAPRGTQPSVVEVRVYAHIAQAQVVPVGEAGIPLLRVDTSLEACGPYSTTWFSYVSPGKITGRRGRVRAALHLVGISDPPEWSGYEVTFDARNQRAVVSRTYSVEDDDENLAEAGEEFLYELTDGVFQPIGNTDTGHGRRRWGDWHDVDLVF